MIIGVVKETKEYENRVALSPEVVKLIRKKGFDVVVESGAGEKSFFSNQDYEDVGASIGTTKDALGADLVLKVNLASLQEIALMKEGAAYISYMYAYQHPDVVAAFNNKRISSFAMDAVPRISRAQKMDALAWREPPR
jgi:NAD(P) transhydrogenase subunit alpha